MTARRAAGSPWSQIRGFDRWLWCGIDALAIVTLLGAIVVALWPVYGTWWLAVSVVGMGAAGIAVGVVSALKRMGSGVTVLLLVAAWFLFGTALMMPSSGTSYVIPTARSLWGLLTGPVTAWRDMLTLEPPIGETFNLLCVGGFIGLIVGVSAISIALRTPRPDAAWLPVAAGWLVATALGSQVSLRPLWVGVAVVVVVLLWTSHRRSRLRTLHATKDSRIKPVSAVLGALSLAAAVAGTYFLLPIVAPDQPRRTIREHIEPPINLEQYASPLQGFRANITKHEQDIMFEVQGLPDQGVLRIATLDKYDGQSFQVASQEDEAVAETTFTRVGQWIDDDTPGSVGTMYVNVKAYDGVWVPTQGKSTSFEFRGPRAIGIGETFFYNHATGTGLTSFGLRDGDTYQVGTLVAGRPDDVDIAEADRGEAVLPRIEGMPEALRTQAQTWTETAGTAGEKVLALERALQQGYFSHGQDDEVRSLSGHTQARLTALVEDPSRMVGDSEQYAAAMTLMVRDLGIPARVVYGYRGNGTASVLGKDVWAWSEVQLDELGWVIFDPTPPPDRILEDEDNPPPPVPRPHVDNPPPPPDPPEVPPVEEELGVDEVEPDQQNEPVNWEQIGRYALLVGIPLITIVLPITLILGLKARRRARRRNNAVLANRWAGAWDEVVDRARDLGKPPSGSATRSEQAEQLLASFPKLADTLDPVAASRAADRVVFAPDEPDAERAREYWSTTAQLRRSMSRSVNWFTSIGSWLSTRSFRRRQPR